MYPGSGSVSTLNINAGSGSSYPMDNVLTHRNHSDIGESEDVLVGTEAKMDLSGSQVDKIEVLDGSDEHKMGQLFATAICGNDITSSIFYTSSLCTAAAGKYAPVSLSIVIIVLYLFRKVYGEVGSALPLNGGAYNVLLNTTTKQVAAVAAALTMISYMATAVVSAESAMSYLQVLWEGCNVKAATIILLGIFAVLNLIGISESAVVAFVIFAIHIVTLTIFVVGGFILFFMKHETTFPILRENWYNPDGDCPTVNNQTVVPFYQDKNFAKEIYFGFGAAMLGVTGFETSSNFIEQQEPGVFPKTLRNMWIIVSIFNPLIGFLNLCFERVCVIASDTSGGILAKVAGVAFGEWFKMWVGIDAVLVLAGSVLTSYVGVIGLVRRMALDRVLPQFLIQTNPFRKTTHWIIILFFGICSSLFLIVDGNTDVLSGVYTVAFLGVMSLFAIGNMLLKYKRSSLRREIKSPWIGVLIALCSVIMGLAANIIREAQIVYYFGIYFLVTIFIIMLMFIRARILKMFLFFTQIILSGAGRDRVSAWLGDSIKKINSQPIIFFASKDDPAYLNKAILYIRDNESTNWVKVVHCCDIEESSDSFSSTMEFLDKCYPKIRLDLIRVNASFTPETVQKISQSMQIPKNFMFISCPKDQTVPHSIGDFGGVRMITSF
ncbi:hypothetical protein DICPUDRAFT_55909 [Dictyostelium purpureum]|uniref:Amino acid permease/ SLC12A domain-containing protein n=1 Tax=Dictyostelium purpureum TaxID=5786 RepID=F0ZP19_DICPU|nr:uncharacterized protein DICPUDRAFT_55909 [Dictyostelium purpureum]EGC34327.1 hypothetical protein DICPUDRAFT_55909 [Dictyostelium purpureum]|eukprot:XP_003289163.1 hypothetical protein DICPUDRAFT_55909 [Dictyostelium purpureum]